MKRGIFISFEGADGCGKSTQARYLMEALQKQGFDVVLTREPGGCPISEMIRNIVLDKNNKDILDITEAYLYASSRAQHVHEIIKPALEKGKIVLCDRFIHSSIAYQGYGRKLGKQRVLDINKHAISDCMPDATFFIKIDPKRAFDRMNELKDLDRIERQDSEFHERLFEGFIKISQDKDENMIAIDASGTKYETRDKIYKATQSILKKKGLLK
jgi:dTMP kinase